MEVCINCVELRGYKGRYRCVGWRPGGEFGQGSLDGKGLLVSSGIKYLGVTRLCLSSPGGSRGFIIAFRELEIKLLGGVEELMGVVSDLVCRYWGLCGRVGGNVFIWEWYWCR